MKLFSLPLVHCSPRRFFMPGCYFFLHKRERGLHLCGGQAGSFQVLYKNILRLFCAGADGRTIPRFPLPEICWREKEKKAGFRAPVK